MYCGISIYLHSGWLCRLHTSSASDMLTSSKRCHVLNSSMSHVGAPLAAYLTIDGRPARVSGTAVALSSLNVLSPTYVGGVPAASNVTYLAGITSSFTGCIQTVQVRARSDSVSMACLHALIEVFYFCVSICGLQDSNIESLFNELFVRHTVYVPLAWLYLYLSGELTVRLEQCFVLVCLVIIAISALHSRLVCFYICCCANLVLLLFLFTFYVHRST